MVYSSVLDAKKEKTLKKRIAKQKEKLQKLAKELAKQRFACIPYAETALKKLQAKAEEMGFTTQGEIKQEEKRSYSGRDRPRPDLIVRSDCLKNCVLTSQHLI